MSGGWERGVIRRGLPGGRRCVIKLGGSLLAHPAWPELFATLVQAELRNRNVVLVVGGGAIVDGLRTLDVAHPLPQERAHRLAIELLGVTAQIVAERLGAVAERMRLTHGNSLSLFGHAVFLKCSILYYKYIILYNRPRQQPQPLWPRRLPQVRYVI